jgi:hypothetical protein
LILPIAKKAPVNPIRSPMTGRKKLILMGKTIVLKRGIAKLSFKIIK